MPDDLSAVMGDDQVGAVDRSGPPRATAGSDSETQPLVSIVITSFNYADFLAEAIDSAFRQTYQPVEVIVVNDGSTDATETVALSYGDRIAYLHQENSGVSVARNAGIRMARGDYVACLDADDTLVPEFLERSLPCLRDHPDAGFVYSQFQLFGRESGVSEYPSYDLAQLKQMNFIHASALIRSSVLKTHLYNERLTVGPQDWDFYLTLAEHGIYGVLVDEPLLNYRKHTSRTSSLDSRTFKEHRTRLIIVNAHPTLYSGGEKLVARLKAAIEPSRKAVGRWKRSAETLLPSARLRRTGVSGTP